MTYQLPVDVVTLDTETTGLDLENHEVWEVAFAHGEGPVLSYQLVHSLATANFEALEINGYYNRNRPEDQNPKNDLQVRMLLADATILGANPGFDIARLAYRWKTQPWHYRTIDVESVAIGVLGLDKPLGLKGLVDRLAGMGYDIPTGNHTAAGDVVTTREVYRALRDISDIQLEKGRDK